MNRIATAPILLAATIAAAPLAVSAEGVELLPVMKEGYQAAPTLSLLVGAADYDVTGLDSDTVAGIEAAFDCPLVRLPGGTVRQQVSITGFDEDGLDVTSFELNPHYLVPVSDTLAIGFGPGIGYLDADLGGDDEGVWALQAGVSAHLDLGTMFVGAELRQQWTQEERIAGRDRDLDNARLMLKVGVKF